MKNLEKNSTDTPQEIAVQTVASANETAANDRLFYMEKESDGPVSRGGFLVRKHSIKNEDGALGFLSLRGVARLLLSGALNTFNSFTAQDFENLVDSVKTAFTTASLAPLSAYSLTSNFAAQAVTKEAQQAIAVQFNIIQKRAEIAQDPTFMGPMPTEKLEQLRYNPNNLNALKNAFEEAGFIYTGNNQAVCTPEKFKELVNQFGAVASNEPENKHQPTVLVATFSNEAQECGATAPNIQNTASPVRQVALPELRNDQVA